MAKLKEYREKLNLTQEELAQESGISVRTIQRIEAGQIPKGYTLKTLAEALNITASDLTGTAKEMDYSKIKWINLSSLPFIILPCLNFVVPLIIMFLSKERVVIVKKIISLQIIWTIVSAILFLSSAILRNWLHLNHNTPVVVLGLLLLLNIFIILRNTVELDRKGRLYIDLKFSLI